MTNITPEELFRKVAFIATAEHLKPATQNKLMHETLVLTCAAGLSGEAEMAGSLFAKVDVLCKQRQIRQQDVFDIQRMRHDSNQTTALTRDDLLYDLRALAVLIAKVFDVSIPAFLTGKIPASRRPQTEVRHVDYRSVRAIVRSFTDTVVTVQLAHDADEHLLRVDYSAHDYLRKIFREGMQLNLLDVSMEKGATPTPANDTPVPADATPVPADPTPVPADATPAAPLHDATCRMIIVEPDFLIDISSLAACFTAYGHSPLAYTINRMRPAANSQAILIGNFAGSALDDIINRGPDYDWTETFRTNFREKALEYCTCPDLNEHEPFKVEAQRQVKNIKDAVELLKKSLTPSPSPSGRGEGLTPSPSPSGRGEGLTPSPSPSGRGEGLTPIPSPSGRGADTEYTLVVNSGESPEEATFPSQKGKGLGDEASRPRANFETAHSDIYGILKAYAQENRKEATDAEYLLWERLRDNQLGVKFRRQHAIGDYIADFACIKCHLVIEVDGGYHSEPTLIHDDQVRTKILNNYGYRVLRFKNEEVLFDTDKVVDTIVQSLGESSEEATAPSQKGKGLGDEALALLEPSFICEQLGLQGRIDLMTTDLRLLVEQKSGKNFNIQLGRPGEHGAYQSENHYVQVLLYYEALNRNFQLPFNSIDGRLLYSKYQMPGGLVNATYYRGLIDEALRLRNQIVATEFFIARRGFGALLPLLEPESLRQRATSEKLWNNYVYPQLSAVTTPLHQLPPVADAYLRQMMTFVYREQLASRLGVVEGTGNAMADLWNMPLVEKKETGNIYTDLAITKKEQSSDYNGYDTITLRVPAQGDDFLPNFRLGDGVYLYPYLDDEEPDVRHALLFRGTLISQSSDEVVVHLSDGQQNPENFEAAGRRNIPGHHTVRWAIEHSGGDIGTTSAIRSLHAFISDETGKRDLLLCQREPQCDAEKKLTKAYSPTYDEIVEKAKQAKDYYLLVGPPGTGKTSMALQFLVREGLASLTPSPSEGLTPRSLTPRSLTPSPSPSGRGADTEYTLVVNSGESPVDATAPSQEGKGLGDEASGLGDEAILLMAYTNRAVDEICGMLSDNGIDYLRLGNEYACDKRYRDHLLDHAIEKLTKLSDIKQKIVDTRVIVGTTSTMLSRAYLFNIKHFRLAIVDEASQILEPNLVGLLTLPEKFILIGDYKQLPAVVQQDEEAARVDDPLLQAIGLDNCRNSLFERLIRNEQRAGRTQFVGILNHQGRMHPAIADFPNQAFYFREHILPVPLPHQTETSLAYDQPSEDAVDDLLKAHRVIFFPSEDCRQPDLSDKVNASEAHIVADLLRRIHRFYGDRFDADKTVGVIVPYRNQIAMIRRQIEQLAIPDLLNISIDTVERYQGSQRDVIIYSFTIQQRYQLDFLTSNTFLEDGHLIDRKLNVALTRARRQLLLTGNVRTLSHNKMFKELIESCGM